MLDNSKLLIRSKGTFNAQSNTVSWSDSSHKTGEIVCEGVLIFTAKWPVSGGNVQTVALPLRVAPGGAGKQPVVVCAI